MLDFSLTPFVELLLDNAVRTTATEPVNHNLPHKLNQRRAEGRELFRVELTYNQDKETVILYSVPVKGYEERIETWLTYWVTERSIQRQFIGKRHQNSHNPNLK